jgi:hypothetical protein
MPRRRRPGLRSCTDASEVVPLCKRDSELPVALVQWPRLYRRGEGHIVGARTRLIASALLVLVAAVSFVGAVSEQEAAGQTPKDPSNGPTPTASPVPQATSPSAFAPPEGPGKSFGGSLGSASPSAQADGSKGIPDLSAMDVIGNLKYFSADVAFRCAGSTPTEGNIIWSCAAPARGGSGSYEVKVVGYDPLTISSVTATARGVSQESAASFFSYVTRLCLPNTAPLDPEAWMRENLPTGGQTFTGGTEISVYGTQEVRALEVVASGTF